MPSPLDIPMSEILEQLDIDHPISRLENSIIYLGGPVSSDRGFVLHKSSPTRWDSTLVVKDGISITTSRDILQAIARGEGPEKRLLALGYAGWSPGQLEQE
ncbi:TPA: YqgE/AlgH family protein, partial [Candidatus Poribacteria bacterium]|nr:YqgE/AlgH family protein [Candidatus Poribacteria bacterium]